MPLCTKKVIHGAVRGLWKAIFFLGRRVWGALGDAAPEKESIARRWKNLLLFDINGSQEDATTIEL